jgi:hypothetical protein
MNACEPAGTNLDGGAMRTRCRHRPAGSPPLAAGADTGASA